MKKIDLHIHTISTVSDCDFEFSIEKLIEYVEREELEAIAITNHNLFDRQQYDTISAAISIPVFPGIEVDVENGHLLVITEKLDIDDFCDKCSCVYRHNGGDKNSYLSEQTFIEIFGDLKKYILIPHYEKSPVLKQDRIPNIQKYISCGEVTSIKKFISMKKRDELVPVLFSDCRISVGVNEWPKRQTFIDVEELSISSIKYALGDSSKVSVSPDDGHAVFEVLDNGLCISTGLTVILGKRSSGKSYTLDCINEQFENAKYIKQFDLLSTDNLSDQRQFEQTLRTQGDSVAETFLAPFKLVVEDVKGIELFQDEQDVEKYLTALKKAASEAERRDVFAKCSLFQESMFSLKDLTSLEDLINAVDILLHNTEYRDIVSRYLHRNMLFKLAIDLREHYIQERGRILLMQYTNDIVDSIQRELQVRSSNTPIPEIDFYNILLNREKVKKFVDIAKQVKKKRIIKMNNLYTYRIVTKAEPFKGAQTLQRIIKSKMVFSDAFSKYDDEYEYLQMLKKKEDLPSSEYYKFFAHITHAVLNKYGTPASGGERSEYNLLQQLNNASRCDILLLDEPESSFDNIFLKDGVNILLRELSQNIPVVIATHNNTIGASLHPDYLIYTDKEIKNDGEIKYHLYYGYPSSKTLTDLEGNSISSKDVMLDCLEAGEIAYNDRRHSYEILNN